MNDLCIDGSNLKKVPPPIGPMGPEGPPGPPGPIGPEGPPGAGAEGDFLPLDGGKLTGTLDIDSDNARQLIVGSSTNPNVSPNIYLRGGANVGAVFQTDFWNINFGYYNVNFSRVDFGTVLVINSNGTLTVGADPENPLDVATKRYVDAIGSWDETNRELTLNGTKINANGVVSLNIVGLNPFFNLRNSYGNGFVSGQGGSLIFAPPASNGAWGAAFTWNGGIITPSNKGIGWRSDNDPTQAGPDTGFFFDAKSIVAQRNGDAAQAFRVYNKFTDASNYERGVIDWTTTSDRLTIGVQTAGSGVARGLALVTGQGGVMTMDPFGNTAFNADFGNNILSTLNGVGGAVIAANRVLAFGYDTFFRKVTLGVLEIGSAGGGNLYTGGTRNGFLQWGGQARVTANVVLASNDSLTDVAGLSIAVQAGRTYSFEAYLPINAGAGGVQAGIGGTATATDVQYDGWIVDSGANGIKGNADANALGVSVADAVIVGPNAVAIIKGTITVNAAGTLTVQAAQNTSNAAPTTIKRGSYFLVYDMP